MSVPISASRFGRVHFSSQAPTEWQHIRVRPSDSCREDPISSGTGLGSSVNWYSSTWPLALTFVEQAGKIAEHGLSRPASLEITRRSERWANL